MNVTIVGLGLMGGSLALALRGKVTRLTAVEQHAATRQYALQNRLVDQVTDNLLLGVKDCHLLILATPVRTILRLIPMLPNLRANGCMILDIGSTKNAISEAMGKLPPPFRAVGGHPMCGKEVAGAGAAEGSLYEGQLFILTRNPRTDKVAEHIAEQVVTAVGARSLWLDPKIHDEMVAAISHLPYLVSAVLMATVAPQADGQHGGDERLWSVSASGFRDTARLSGSDPAMLRDILLTNQTAVLAQLRIYQKQLTAVQGLIKRGDETEIAAWLQARQTEYTVYKGVMSKE